MCLGLVVYQTEQEYAGHPQHPAGGFWVSHQPCGAGGSAFLLGTDCLVILGSLPFLCLFYSPQNLSFFTLVFFPLFYSKQLLLPQQLHSMFPFSLSCRVAVHTLSHTFAINFSWWGWASATQLYYSSATSQHLSCWNESHQLILQTFPDADQLRALQAPQTVLGLYHWL